jgi:ElaB/YqjD/DUF883 family membrane-anchored ribosome-binding protein
MADTLNFDRLQKDLRAVKNDISALTEQLTDILNSYSEKASKEARRGFKQARARADEMSSDWSERGMAVYEDARDAAYSMEETLEDSIQERPFAAVALAAGIGFLIGAAWKK